MKKPELLAPAGNLEKLKMAVLYGADAVYAGGTEFNMRAFADNFSMDELKEGIEYVHKMGKRIYVTLNSIPHNRDLESLPDYVAALDRMNVDAVIVSDPGVFSIVRETAPDMNIHISTQANNVNWKTVSFWRRLGAKRVILSRELSLKEIMEIRSKAPDGVELEIFVHGSVCVSYSGRCLLSNYMAGRDANTGECAHPCRWKYYLMEEKRPGEFFPLFEDGKGSYILNSKDLCMIEHIPDIVGTGAASFKIEGRMKSSYYVAVITKAYRQAIDSYFNDPSIYAFNAKWLEEVEKASHREYTTGFYYKRPGPCDHAYESSDNVKTYDFIGLVMDFDEQTGTAVVEQRNRMLRGEYIEVVPPKGDYFIQEIEWMRDERGEYIESALHPQMIVTMPIKRKVGKYTILRRRSV